MHGRLFANLAAFGRVLRGAGLRIGPGRMETALSAVALAGIRRKHDFYWALRAALVADPAHVAAFDTAFELFWGRRAHESLDIEVELWKDDADTADEGAETGDVPPDAWLLAAAADEGDGDRDGARRDSPSAIDMLRDKHFDRMTTDELAAAKRAIERLAPALPRYPTRRHRHAPSGTTPDLRRSLQAVARTGSLSEIQYTAPREERPALVLLCDISGSMQVYSRVLLHFACALSARHDKAHAFLVGTRLTDVTRTIRRLGPAAAVDRICAETRDFDAGTRLGSALLDFNKSHARRLLSRRAIVVLVTDGLEGASTDVLELELARLTRSCGHVMWLNPLLRFEGYEPLAEGVRIMTRHVHSVRGVHSLRCVEDVARALAAGLAREPRPVGSEARAG
jgi:uncharacterized protein